MISGKFWGSKKAKSKSKKSEKTIPDNHLRGRRSKISGWAREAQTCDVAIANIDEQLSKLSGPFTRAKRELLLARRTVWVGRLNIAEAHLKKEKSSLSGSLKHNLELTTRRLAS